MFYAAQMDSRLRGNDEASALAASVSIIEATTRRATDVLRAVSDDERLLRALTSSAIRT